MTHELGFTYVQGMNVLAAPFLYTMPSEVEAFFCFAKFIEDMCPLYVQPTLEGVHRGLKAGCNYPILSTLHLPTRRQLLDRCLKIVDPDLYQHLRSKNLSAELYAFPCSSSHSPNAVTTDISCSDLDPMCMHPTSRSSSATMGLLAWLRGAPECLMCHRPNAAHAR
jgi:hypothetical protein